MKSLDQLIKDLNTDESLREKLAAAGNDPAAADAVLADAGYAVTAADLRDYAEQQGVSEPTEEELRKVAGGASTSDVNTRSEILVILGGVLASGCWA